MKINQNDLTIESSRRAEQKTEIEQDPPSIEDERCSTSRKLSISYFSDKIQAKIFSMLGRVTIVNEPNAPWRLAPEKRRRIQELVSKKAGGQSLVSVHEAGISPSDILAFAAEGASLTSSKLEAANRDWWKNRENSPCWQIAPPPIKHDFLNRLLETSQKLTFLQKVSFFFHRTSVNPECFQGQRFLKFRLKRKTWKIISDLGFTEEEGSTLFKIDSFSRLTVYSHDRALIPRGLRALFKMKPRLIFTPRTSEQLRRFMEFAYKKKLVVVPRGRGTGDSGGALPVKGGIVCEMASFEKKIVVDAQKLLLTVSASVDFHEAEEALNQHNLTLSVRPSNKYAAICGFLSVGQPFYGGIGLNAFAHGPVRNSVESIRIVRSSGQERLVKKESTEFPFYFGTNGRFGIITEVTLKAIPKPVRQYPLVFHFSNSASAFKFLQKFQNDLKSGNIKPGPVHIEFIGKSYLTEVENLKASKKNSITVNLISPESKKRQVAVQDTLLFVFNKKGERKAFSEYLAKRGDIGMARQREAEALWEQRFSPMKLRKKGDLLRPKVVLPLEQVALYLKEITEFTAEYGIKILPVAYILSSNEALVIPQFLTDRRRGIQYHRHFSLIPLLARRAVKRFQGRPYGFGIWLSGLARTALGDEVYHALKREKKQFDPKAILNPGKLTEIDSRFWNVPGNIVLHETTLALLEKVWLVQIRLSKINKFKKIFTANKAEANACEKVGALHRCIICSACMICPLAQIWEKSGDPRLMQDAIYITPRFKMEYMQQHIYQGKKLTQQEVDRFVLCLRCGVAEREAVCPISDLLLDVNKHESAPCQKKLPTYDEFEARLRKQGYDVDGAIQRYLDILQTHPGVANAMKENLGNYRVPATGDKTVWKPKNDFAIYKVEVDEDRCINCGKCGDEHTASQRGFWNPENPRKMVSLDDLLNQLNRKVPKNWFDDNGGPLPKILKKQGKSNGDYVYFSKSCLLDTGHHHCNGCLYCVHECPVDAIRVNINDYYTGLAGKDFTSEDVRRINEEARTGDIPTSGSGSAGLFGGKRFERYMFDFSVIVRPARDGNCEPIDIGVNLGRKPLFHLFEHANNGYTLPKLKTQFYTLDLPAPFILELPVRKGGQNKRDLIEIFLHCARREGTILIMNLFQFIENFKSVNLFISHVGLRILPEEIETIKAWNKIGEVDHRILDAIKAVPFLEIVHDFTKDSHTRLWHIQKLKGEIFNPKLVVSCLLECRLNSDHQIIADAVEFLAQSGAEIIHLKTHFNADRGYYETENILSVCYNRLLSKSLHTQVTLITNGMKSPADSCIAMMLGASAVVLDRVILVALNHEFPMLEEKGIQLPEVEFEGGLRRLQNLFNSWRQQIQTVLGAIGVRDIRRMVGERGRLIDLKDREIKMQAMVEDEKLLHAAKKVNGEKIVEDGELARSASWKYSELSELIAPVTPPDVNLIGERSISLNSMLAARGDRRWIADLLKAAWLMSSGALPSHKAPQTGCDFGGGSFDAMEFAPVKFSGKTMSLGSAVEEIDRNILAGDLKLHAALDNISVSAGDLNKHRRPKTAPYVSHFLIDAAELPPGFTGWKFTLARYLAGTVLKRFTGTGAGEYPLVRYDRLQEFFPNLSDEEVKWLAQQMEQWVAVKVTPGYFGITEDTIRRANKIVVKFAQGAKPGIGGHIPGSISTSLNEGLQSDIDGRKVFTPFIFHDVYCIEDVGKMVEWLRTINPDAIITVKISTPVDVHHIALGLVAAGVDEIQIDAAAGGVLAAPDIARNRIAMPLEYALSDVHKFLVDQGERNKVILVAGGGLRTAYDMAKALILGADKVILGTQEMVAQQCNRCGNCNAAGGCQKGVTTTVPQLEAQKEVVLNAQWLINSQVAVVQHLMKMMYAWGMNDIRELRGRTDLIESWGWQQDCDEIIVVEGKAESAEAIRSEALVQEHNSSKPEDKDLDACGVVSFACTKAVPVASIQTACQSLQHRGNGRGGGISGLGRIFSEAFSDCYALQIITLVSEKQRPQKIMQIVRNYLKDFDLFQRYDSSLKTAKLTESHIERFRNPRQQKNGRDITWQEVGLTVDPGDLYRFFVRVKKRALIKFARKILEECRIPVSERQILENGNPLEFYRNINIDGKWIEYYTKYFHLLTDEYLDAVDPNCRFWENPQYESLWRDLEDEFVCRQAFKINQKYYIEPQNLSEEPLAFVASMMKDGGIWKLVGYAEQAADYWIVGDAQYVPITKLNKTIKDEFKNKKLILDNLKSKKNVKWCLKDKQLEIDIRYNSKRKMTILVPKYGEQAAVIFNRDAHVWIGHQRFPTVFNPVAGGNQPLYGRVYEALTHNGDFANYKTMLQYWQQFGGTPQYRTDAEIAAKAYAILKQMGYPQIHIFEVIAPTTGIDLKRLKNYTPELAADFSTIQKSQIAGSPDGPWFFNITDQDSVSRDLKLIGLTDTSALRPSVFLWQQNTNDNWASIGLVASEESACRSVLNSLYQSDVLASKEPDYVRSVRGGSLEQNEEGEVRGGGVIVYNLKKKTRDKYDLIVSDKFGNVINQEVGQHCNLKAELNSESDEVLALAAEIINSEGGLKFNQADAFYTFVKTNLKLWDFNTFRWFVEILRNCAKTDELIALVVETLTMIKDRIAGIEVGIGPQIKKRASLIQIITDKLDSIFDSIELLGTGPDNRKYYRLICANQNKIFQCTAHDKILVVDATGFPPDGHRSLARTLIYAYKKGWKKVIVYKITGQRYLGTGLGPQSHDLEMHLYGSTGQDLANSMMGGTVHIHANTQNDMGKILHSGTVVVHGLAGNTGVYGAQGGEIFVSGNVGARWAINSASSPTGPGPKVVIVGSAMEYLAESLTGGMVLMLGLEWDINGVLRRKYLPYPGNSILAGASAGKVVIYDPDARIEKAQYPAAVDTGFLSNDWLAVYKNLTSLVKQSYSKADWFQNMERWHSMSRISMKSEEWLLPEKQDALDELIDLLKAVMDSENDFKKLQQNAQTLKSVVENRFTGKEWRTLVRQLGQILTFNVWKEGVDLLDRMMDWKEVIELLTEADRYFDLGLTLEKGKVYLPLHGKKTELKRGNFKVLRPLKQEKNKLGNNRLELDEVDESVLVEEDFV